MVWFFFFVLFLFVLTFVRSISQTNTTVTLSDNAAQPLIKNRCRRRFSSPGMWSLLFFFSSFANAYLYYLTGSVCPTSNIATAASSNGIRLQFTQAHGMFSLCHGISFFFFFVLMIIYTEQSSYVRHRQHGIKRRHPSANNAFQAPGTCLLLFFYESKFILDSFLFWVFPARFLRWLAANINLLPRSRVCSRDLFGLDTVRF